MHFDYIIIHYINEDHTEPMVPDSPASPDPESPTSRTRDSSSFASVVISAWSLSLDLNQVFWLPAIWEGRIYS